MQGKFVNLVNQATNTQGKAAHFLAEEDIFTKMTSNAKGVSPALLQVKFVNVVNQATNKPDHFRVFCQNKRSETNFRSFVVHIREELFVLKCFPHCLTQI